MRFDTAVALTLLGATFSVVSGAPMGTRLDKREKDSTGVVSFQGAYNDIKKREKDSTGVVSFQGEYNDI